MYINIQNINRIAYFYQWLLTDIRYCHPSHKLQQLANHMKAFIHHFVFTRHHCINCSNWCLTSVAEQPRCHNICLSQPEPDIHFSFKQTKRQKFQKLGIQKEDICMGGCMVMVKNRICCLITLASPSPSPSTNTTSVFPLQLPELHKKHQFNDAF